jgi:hypothetical protein
MNRLGLVFAIALLTAACFAQDKAPGERDSVHVNIMGPGFQEPVALQGEAFFLSSEMEVSHEVLRNAPYTATAVTQSTQTLADGNRITKKSSAFLARDGQGRTRREESIQKMGALNVEGPSVILIGDPVSRTDYVVLPTQQTVSVRTREDLDATVSVGLRRKLESMTLEGSLPRRSNNEEEKADVKHEDLGMQQIEGLACQGKRDTLTIPAGQVGNELPLVITTEIWTSQDLHGIVLKKHNDPRFGETEYRLTNIKTGEPDASLFQPPAGYKRLNETRTFTFTQKEKD